ncbi:hypothetical protein WT94_14930 [Burkholderia stagnalis]|nr:hypothetical protein WT76_29620 [Burkholderia stagnalis]KWO24632.1 hypothetical protein WT94_14930 [Burkholderia stagnalis]
MTISVYDFLYSLLNQIRIISLLEKGGSQHIGIFTYRAAQIGRILLDLCRSILTAVRAPRLVYLFRYFNRGCLLVKCARFSFRQRPSQLGLLRCSKCCIRRDMIVLKTISNNLLGLEALV